MESQNHLISNNYSCQIYTPFKQEELCSITQLLEFIAEVRLWKMQNFLHFNNPEVLLDTDSFTESQTLLTLTTFTWVNQFKNYKIVNIHYFMLGVLGTFGKAFCFLMNDIIIWKHSCIFVMLTLLLMVMHM